MVSISFKDGTLLIEAQQDTELPITDLCVYDVRISAWRAEACAYADIIMALHHAAIPYDDQAHCSMRSIVGTTTSVERLESSIAICATNDFPVPVGRTMTPRRRDLFQASMACRW